MSGQARVAILISGRGSNMAALIEAARAPDFPAKIALVLSNKPDAGGIETARRAGIATEVVESKAYADRGAFEAAMQERLAAHGSNSSASPASCASSARPSSRAGADG